ncbi:hypothetical protein AAC387_Pa07g2457 [Persea americana]
MSVAFRKPHLLPSSSFSLLSLLLPRIHLFNLFLLLFQGSKGVVYEARLDGTKVTLKRPVLFTSDDLDEFHKELQLLCTLDHPGPATLVAAHPRPTNYMFFF